MFGRQERSSGPPARKRDSVEVKDTNLEPLCGIITRAGHLGPPFCGKYVVEVVVDTHRKYQRAWKGKPSNRSGLVTRVRVRTIRPSSLPNQDVVASRAATKSDFRFLTFCTATGVRARWSRQRGRIELQLQRTSTDGVINGPRRERLTTRLPVLHFRWQERLGWWECRWRRGGGCRGFGPTEGTWGRGQFHGWTVPPQLCKVRPPPLPSWCLVQGWRRHKVII